MHDKMNNNKCPFIWRSSVTNFIKIGLFSKIAQVTVRTLRHYDELGLFKPAYIEPSTNYRFYTYDQLIRLNQILVLKDAGFSLDQISDMIQKDMTIEEMTRIMYQKKEELALQINEANQQLKSIETRLHQLAQVGQETKYNIVLKQGTNQNVMGLRRIVPKPQDMQVYRSQMFRELNERVSQMGYVVQQEYVFYHMNEFIEENFDIEVAYTISEKERSMSNGDISIYELPAEPLVASLVYKGPFMGIADALLELFTWVGINGYSLLGAVRELHLFGSENGYDDCEDVLVELQLPIER